MGHVAMSGDKGSVKQLAELNIRRKIYVHINNTNPILIEDSPERASVEAAGWDVAYDGMEIVL
jgi:pyrroloquinoline quinone biosynthesis protein B